MAMRCDYCQKGVVHGHAVSHAKNRVGRLFKPNLQVIKVLKNGTIARVKFCTRCIKRLKKDSRMGPFAVMQFAQKEQQHVAATVSVEMAKIAKTVAEMVKEPTGKKEKKSKESEKLQLDAIVGKKS